ncbi:hypothetical protein AAHS21_15825 [Mycobacterium sp. 050272]|uniref:hypothetical protein n=1 Tax=Mycobacterium sp. 050272 TaxID=3142488 RepID=UPI003187C936
MPQYDDGQDDIAALTFSDFSQPGADRDSDVQALVFSAASDGGAQESTIEDLRAWAPTQPDDGVAGEGDAMRAQVSGAGDADGADQDEASQFLATVANPSRTIVVTAQLDGSVQQLKLSSEVASMAESALADEILAIADLARQKGLAVQRAMVSAFMTGMALDRDLNDDVVRQALEELPTPEQAEESRAEVFASRYASDTD